MSLYFPQILGGEKVSSFGARVPCFRVEVVCSVSSLKSGLQTPSLSMKFLLHHHLPQHFSISLFPNPNKQIHSLSIGVSSIVCRKEGRKSEMGLLKEKKPNRILRGVKTFFFLVRMTVSLLLCSAPVILVVADALIHWALLSASISPPLSLDTLSSLLRNYEFRNSIVDIPIISIARSLVIICVYCMCDGPGLSHGPYLGVTTLCSLLSLVFVSMKAFSFGPRMRLVQHRYFDEWWAMEAMFLCSLIVAVGHIVFAYRTSCRERRKLLVYRIDLEAVLQIPSSKKDGFPIHQKLLQQVRTN